MKSRLETDFAAVGFVTRKTGKEYILFTFFNDAAKCYWSGDAILHNIRFIVQGTASQNTGFLTQGIISQIVHAKQSDLCKISYWNNPNEPRTLERQKFISIIRANSHQVEIIRNHNEGTRRNFRLKTKSEFEQNCIYFFLRSSLLL